ncbi:hypothetical protein OC861_000348 [Tilletia horrida]|nr:hypothetical protein OC861_000348 [Tilletia horrida]
MPLHLAQHKSYHPYNEKNKERVRQDEEQERVRLEEEQRQRQDVESEARIEALRRARGKGHDRQDQVGPEEEEDRGVGPSAGPSRWEHQSHINFFAELEAPPGTRSTGTAFNKPSRFGPPRSTQAADRSAAAGPVHHVLDRETLAHALGGPSAKEDRQPWYAEADLQSAADRKKSAQQRLRAARRDTATKTGQDPLQAMMAGTAKRQEMKDKRQRAIEHARAIESPYGQPPTPHTMAIRAGEYSDQYSREDAQAARKRRRGSSPSSRHRDHYGSDHDEDDRRHDRRRARHDDYDDRGQGFSADRRRSSYESVRSYRRSTDESKESGRGGSYLDNFAQDTARAGMIFTPDTELEDASDMSFAAGSGSSNPAPSIPPCGQPLMHHPYSHHPLPFPIRPHGASTRHVPPLPYDPSSSLYDDIKNEPESDDMPIADLMGDPEPGIHSNPTRRRQSSHRDELDSEADSVSDSQSPTKSRHPSVSPDEVMTSEAMMDPFTPSPPSVKPETLSSQPIPPQSAATSVESLATLANVSPEKGTPMKEVPLQPMPPALNSDPFVTPPSSGDISKDEQVNQGAAVKPEPVSQNLPATQDCASDTTAAERPLPTILVPFEAETLSDGTVATSDPIAPVTLFRALDTGLLPRPRGVSRLAMPSLTQSSEYDELVGSSQLSGADAATINKQTLQDVTDKTEQAQGDLDGSNAEDSRPTDPACVLQPPAGLGESESKQEAPGMGDSGDSTLTSTDASRQEPDRNQQQHWQVGIWRSQKANMTPHAMPTAFDAMRSTTKQSAVKTEGDGLKRAGSPESPTENESVSDVPEIPEEIMAPLDDQVAGETAAETRFRESMYPSVLQEMIKTVLERESFLFSSNEVSFLGSYEKLTYEARYLFARLIQRKHKWYRVNLFKYYNDLKNTPDAVKELVQSRSELEAQHSQHVQSLSTADDPFLTRFAYDQHDLGFKDDVSGMLSLMILDELKPLAKQMGVLKAGITTRAAITEALLSAKSQGTLGGGLSLSPGRQSRTSGSPAKRNTLRQLTLNFDRSGNKTAQSSVLKTSVQKIVGDLIYIPVEVRSLIDRLAVVYYRGNIFNSNFSSALTQAVLARCKRRIYPDVEVRRTDNLFKSREQLKQYELACAQEYKMVLFVDGNFEVSRSSGSSSGSYIGQAAYMPPDEDLPMGGSPEACREGIRLLEEVLGQWKAAVAECQEEDSVSGDRLTYYRMRFHPGWPLTRILHKACYCFGRFKQYEREEEILKLLLDQKVFCRGRRGEWYDRLALITERYLEGPKSRQLRAALEIACHGMEDPDVHLVHQPALIKRIERLENSRHLIIRFADRHDFAPMKLKTHEEIELRGFRLDRMVTAPETPAKVEKPASEETVSEQWKKVMSSKPSPTRPTAPRRGSSNGQSPTRSTSAGPSRGANATQRSPSTENLDVTSFTKRTNLQKEVTYQRPVQTPQKGKAVARAKPEIDSMEVDNQDGENEDDVVVMEVTKEIRRDMHSVWRGANGENCRVEELCLQEFAKDGFKGYHCEGGMLTMLFVLAMWDIIYMPIDGAFETKYQSEPLDMRSDAFAIVRKEEMMQRLESISKGDGLDHIRAADERERPRGTWASGCNWDRYTRDDLLEVAECMGGGPLATICQVFCEDREHCQGGMPDLCIWNMETKEVRFVEVKGPGDSLRDKQRIWIDTLARAGLTVQVATVKDVLDLKQGSSTTGTKRSSPKK